MGWVGGSNIDLWALWDGAEALRIERLVDDVATNLVYENETTWARLSL